MSDNLGASILGIIPTLLVLGITVALIKSFQGKEYEYDSAHRSKPAADKRVRDLRDMDLKARISKESENGKSVWVVYKRDESGFSFF